MELHDDFDSLLKGAAERYSQPALSEQTVSNIIDDKLIKSKNNLRAAFKKEIVLIVICLLCIVYLLVQHPVSKAFKIAILGGILYLAGSILLFVKLIQVANLHKDSNITDYLKRVCTKTAQAMRLYVLISTIAATWCLTFLFVGYPWYYMVGGTLLMAIVTYFLNSYYTKKRFGKQLQEMKQLLSEFNQ